MAGFRVLPIDSALAEQVRSTLKSPQYGHPAHVELATGYGPCRACLKQFRTGEEDRILFTYNPFESLDSYPSPGPVFIHAKSCPGYDALQSFPEELRSLPLTLEAYGADRWIIARTSYSGRDRKLCGATPANQRCSLHSRSQHGGWMLHCTNRPRFRRSGEPRLNTCP